MLNDVQAYIDSNEAAFIEDLKTILKFPSVSADSKFKQDLLNCADWLKKHFEDIGLTAEIIPTAGHPIVYAEWLGAPGAPTVLIYGHYDVQPADPLNLWTTPAFEPTIRDGKIYARGATDDKGQFLTHVKAVQSWMKVHGKLPVNVKFVIEGEEEVGSNNLDLFLEANKKKVACDVAVISDCPQYGPGLPAITYGLRGMYACEVTIHGPNRDLHSGAYGGSVANPATYLAHMLASLHDKQGKIQVAGFYDGVIPLEDDERTAYAALPFDEKTYLNDIGLKVGFGEPGFTTNERRWARPTIEINGLYSGYIGEGPKTIVPSYAFAKITCRLVPGQTPHEVGRALETHLRQQCSIAIRMEFKEYHGCEASLVDRHSPYMAAAKKAIKTGFGKEPLLIREGGTIPVVKTLKDMLGVDTLLLGWGLNSDCLHSPNEHFTLADYQRGTKASAALFTELAERS